jgi:integrase
MAHSKITVNKLNSFLKTAEDRQQLHSPIAGLYFIKLKNGGAWRLRYTDSDGKRRSPTIADHTIKPAEVESIANDWKAQIRQGNDPLAAKQQNKQQRAAKQHLNTGKFFKDIYTPALIKHSGIKSAKNNCGIIERDFAHLLDRDMDTLTAQDVRAWENKRKADGASRGLLQRNYAAFKAMLNYAAGKKRNHSNDHPILIVNPLSDISLQQISHTERQIQNEREEELQQERDLIPQKTMASLINGLELFDKQVREKRHSSRLHGKSYLTDLDDVAYAHWFVPFMHIARLTGMRPGDILTLKWQYIQTSIKTRSKLLTFKPNKTKHHDNAATVTIPLTGELNIVFSKWSKQQGEPTSGLIFESKISGEAMDQKAYQRHWREVKRLGGVDKDLHFYSFRHNLISELVGRGVPLLRIAKLVGHKDASMIAEHYFHEDVDDLGDILAATGDQWRASA